MGNLKPFSFVLAFCLMLFTKNGISQVQTPRYISMTVNSNAFYEYLPQGYPEPGVKYPLMIFAHGQGELGPGTAATLPTVLYNGVPKLINNGTFPVSFTVGGVVYKFIILSPQFTTRPANYDFDNIIDYAEANYNVDINRVYLTGLSMGGGVIREYTGSNLEHAQRVAAVVEVCGASAPYAPFIANDAQANLPVWATHNSQDPTIPPSYTIDYVNMLNALPAPPSPRAKATIFTVSAPQHDAWTKTYDPLFEEDNMNVYEWMLQYKRFFTVLPVTGLDFNALKTNTDKVLIQWRTTTETSTHSFSILRSNDAVNFRNIGIVPAAGINGGGASYSFTDKSPLSGTNYYKLELQDADGTKSYSSIKPVQIQRSTSVNIYPNPSADFINIESSDALNKAALKITNAAGQVVQSQVITATGVVSVNISALLPGLYNAQLNNNNNIKIFRFLKR